MYTHICVCILVEFMAWFAFALHRNELDLFRITAYSLPCPSGVIPEI